jgi:exosome complex component CSL4
MIISIVNNRPVPESSEEFIGVVRVADIRSVYQSHGHFVALTRFSLTERDKVKMSECFRLGDIVKAKVVS